MLHQLVTRAVAYIKCLREGRSPRWHEKEQEHLNKEPFCRACGTRKYLIVHHKIPVSWDPTQELVDTNLITMCETPSHNCHFVIGHLCDWTSYNPEVEPDADAYRGKVQSRPRKHL